MNQASSTATTTIEPPVFLYERHRKIYIRSVKGVFAKWRWALVWITQALSLIHISEPTRPY